MKEKIYAEQLESIKEFTKNGPKSLTSRPKYKKYDITGKSKFF